MIDVWGVFSNSLWVLGLAVLLAVWSYASYEARRRKIKVRHVTNELSYALALNAGMLLFLVGMATTEHRGWARGLWIVVALGVVAESVWRIVKHRKAAAANTNERE
jgi:preprotein translocase subunit SecY